MSYLFEKLPNIDVINIKGLDKLLSWSKSIPEGCKIHYRDCLLNYQSL